MGSHFFSQYVPCINSVKDVLKSGSHITIIKHGIKKDRIYQ